MVRSHLSIFPQNKLFLPATTGHTTQLNSLFQSSHRSFCATFLSLFTRLTTSLSVQKPTLVTILALGFILVIQVQGRMPEDTRPLCMFLQGFLQGLLPFNPEGLSPLRLPYLYGFLPSVCVGALEVEEGECAYLSLIVPVSRCSLMTETARVSLSNTVQLHFSDCNLAQLSLTFLPL